MQILTKRKKSFFILKITLVNIRITLSSQDYRNWAKKSLEENFFITNWDFKKIFYLFPFFFGFYQILFSYYQDEVFHSFFEKNFTIIRKPKENNSWETFDYIKSKKLITSDIKRINLYNDFFIVELNRNNEKFFVGLFPNNLSKNFQKLNSNNYKIVLFDILNLLQNDNFFLKYNLFNKIYYNLDELPFKLDKNIHKKSKKKLQKKSFFKIELITLINEKVNNSNHFFKKQTKKNNFIVKSLENKNFLSNSNFKEYEKFNNFTFGLEKFEKNLDTNQNKNTDFNNLKKVELKTKLQKRLIKLFYKYNVQPFNTIKNYNGKLKKNNYKIYSSKKLLKLLSNILPIQQNQFLITRNFSGFDYPDTLTNDIYSIYFNFLLKRLPTSNYLKINLPFNFISSLKTKSFYYSLLLKKLKISKQKNGFFGTNYNYYSTRSKKLKRKITKFNYQNITLKEISKKETLNFEDLDNSNPIKFFLKYPPIKKSKLIKYESSIFNNLLSRNFKKNFIDTFSEKKINSSSNLFTESLINENFYKISNSREIFKNSPNFSNILKTKKSFFQPINFSFIESWEPLSSHSWMIIMQFSLGFFVFNLLKDLYKDYGKELVEYLLKYANSSGVDIDEIKEQYLYNDQGYRLIKKINKNFKDIAGIDKILPELSEIIWFLRNNGRSALLKNSIPKGILLTGLPGTGKTLLVQTLAGEAKVPIICESGSLLTDQQQKSRGIEKLKKIFDKARELSPCIIFIDEVDTIGEKRKNIIQTTMGKDEIIESIYSNKFFNTDSSFIPQSINFDSTKNQEQDLEYNIFRVENETSKVEKIKKEVEIQKTRINILTQFLVEMDGLKERMGVIVIGATNRPNILDPALIRPGRFDKILKLELPGKSKRIEILKFYSQKIKIDNKVSWNYLANRTKGFSAADLAAVMNESSLQSILQKSKHTIETIERGIDIITSYSTDKKSYINVNKNLKDVLSIQRLAYFQAGKATLQTLLPTHSPVIILHLFPRQKNTRYARFYEKYFIGNKTKFFLEIELIGLYAGKAAEMIPLSGLKFKKDFKNWHSNLSMEDLISATILANLMVESSFLYSNEIIIEKYNTIFNEHNIKEFQENEKLDLLNNIENQLEDEIKIEKLFKLVKKTGYQQRGFGPWWQIQVSKQLAAINFLFSEWFRIYIPDPEESLLNLEWIPPEQFYHSNQTLKTISQKSNLSINETYKIKKDYIYHGLILNAFNKAFSDLEGKREFLDYFADYLMRYEVLREDQIFFILKLKNEFTEISEKKSKNNLKINQEKIYTKKIITKNWGNQSRRQKYRFINFETIKFFFEIIKKKIAKKH